MDSGGIDEADVWAAARGGDADAFQRLFDLHRDRVYGQGLRIMRSAHDAEDVTALVFLEAWRRRDAVPIVNGSIVAWLLVTTNYVCRNLVRTLRRHREAMQRASALMSEPPPDHAADVDDRLDRASRDRHVSSAFARLSQADQDVITLCVLEEFTTAQAAEALGVPPGTVKSRLSRAKQRLARHVGESGITSAGPGDDLNQPTPRTGGAR
jgi:RNA polymerase sigma-70 factor (ECF subfamily)